MPLRRLMAAIAGLAVVLGSYQSGRRSAAPPNPTLVYVTRSGTRYHRAGCRYLARSGGTPTPAGEARDGGYRACTVCGPPTR